MIPYVADITKTLRMLRMLLRFSKKLLQCWDPTIVANVAEFKKGGYQMLQKL